MKSIQVLDHVTVNQIAAGEVVENPASVVKELVENSLDAGADHIEIETCGGGLAFLSVRDNGHGMTSDDLSLCILRHATSKVRAFDDLSKLGTLGFRGEALPSIASVSKMSIHSATDTTDGALIEITGGIAEAPRHQARTKGTTVEIHSLFFNVPARKAFQKSILSNKLALRRVIENLILASPQVTFSWKDDDRIELATEKDDELERLSLVMGKDFATHALKLHKTDTHMTLKGFLGSVLHHKSTRSDQRLFINGRSVISPLLAVKIKNAYGHLLPEHRYPPFVLHATLPADWIDVNVHPQKREIRLRKEETILPFFSKAITQTLQNSSAESYDDSDPFGLGTMNYIMPFAGTTRPKPQEAESYQESNPICDTPSYEKITSENSFSSLPTSYDLTSLDDKEKNSLLKTPPPEDSIDHTPLSETKSSHYQKTFVNKITLIGKIGHFLLSQKDNFFYIVDRIAANHYLLEKSLKENTQPIPIQQLLIPVRIELSEKQQLVLTTHLSLFQRCGIDIRSFGGRSAIIESLPVFLDPEETMSLIINMLDVLQDSDEYLSIENVLNLLSKKKYIKSSSHHANDLTLLYFLEEEKMPLKNPNGTIICKVLEEHDLNKWWIT